MSRFTLLLGGDLVMTPRLAAQVAGSRVIAADAGMQHAIALGVVPELWVGDFDSEPAGLPAELAAVERLRFPAEKDQTDGELAVDAALGRGADRLILAGAFGGPRADHGFFHLALAGRIADRQLPVLLTSGNQEGLPLEAGTAVFDYPAGTMFSILAFTPLAGLTVRGAKWPLDRVTVGFGSSLTLSNEVSDGLEIALEGGRALLIAHPQGALETTWPRLS